MQSMKRVFEFVEHGFTATKIHRACRGNPTTTIRKYARTLAAVLVPCLLQFPLVAAGQVRTDGVNGGLVPVKVFSECVKTKGIAGDGGNAVRKCGFVDNNVSAKNGAPITADGKVVNKKSDANGTDNSDSRGDDWYWYCQFPLSILMFYVAIFGAQRQLNRRAGIFARPS